MEKDTMFGKEWQIPIFSQAEIKRRWEKIRKLMDAREIDCLIIAGHMGNYKGQFGDIRYVSNWINWFDDEYCLFPLRGNPVLYVWAEQHKYWAERVCVIEEIVVPQKTEKGSSYVTEIAKRIKSSGLERGTLGLNDLKTMPAYFYAGLLEELPKANFVEAGDILRECRIIKSPAELEYVRKAGECADKGWEAMRDAMRVGATDYDLAGECERAMIKCGCETGSFQLFNTKTWPDGWGFPHGGSKRPFKKGDISLGEVTPCYGGYYVQLCRAISLGQPPDDFMEVFEIQKQMYQIARDGFRPGSILADVDAEASAYALSKRPFTRASCNFQILDGIVSIPSFFSGELKPGMAFMIHPWTNPSEHEMRTKKGHMGHAGVGDCNIVTEDGPESVSRLPMEVTIV